MVSSGPYPVSREVAKTVEVAPAVVDVKDARINAVKSLQSELAKIKKRIIETLTDAYGSLLGASGSSGDDGQDEDLRATLHERIVLGCLSLGIKLQADGDPDPKTGAVKVTVHDAMIDVASLKEKTLTLAYGNKSTPCPIDHDKLLKAVGEAGIPEAVQHTTILRHAFALIGEGMLPVEAPDKFKSWTCLTQAVGDLRAAANTQSIDEISADAEAQRVLHEQLRVAIDKSAKSMKRATIKRASDAKKVEAKQKSQREKETRAAHFEKAEQAKQHLAYSSKLVGFNLKFADCGHAPMPCFVSDEAFQQALASDASALHKPMKFANS